MRTFVAVEVPTVEVDGSSTGTPDQPAHITLQFLGEFPASDIRPISVALAQVASTATPFEVELTGVGAFPSPHRPRVVWVGVGEGSERLVALAEAVGRALGGLGYPPEERSFNPHVTLFRVRSQVDAQRARELASRTFDHPFARGLVRELLLVESLLGRARMVHGIVARFPLSGPRG